MTSNLPNARKLFIKVGIVCALIVPVLSKGQVVHSWITAVDQKILLQEQPVVNAVKTASQLAPKITIDTNKIFQTIDGFGYTFTEGSAEVISTLSPAKQDDLLNELFNPETGLGISVLRISIGASDLSSSPYSYDDVPKDSLDLNLSKFSLAGPDLTYLIPMLQKIVAINPGIKILGSPWSAPRWMKTFYSYSKGYLDLRYYSVYASYFVKYINAMKAHGINIWAITVQNEPENLANEPSMLMSSTEQISFINNHLGPLFQKENIGTKIIAYDHNCSNTQYPIDVLKNSNYVDGAAFHLYVGKVEAMSVVHDSTNKNIYFTEQYTEASSDFRDFAYHVGTVMIGSTNNWAKTALEWNLATDANYGPFTSSGCKTCMGAITINNNVVIKRNLSYYAVGHMSKVVKPGARRIHSTTNSTFAYGVFKNTDGSIALVGMNYSYLPFSVNIAFGDQNFDYTIPGKSAVSILMGGPDTNQIVVSTPDQNLNGAVNTLVNIPVNVSGGPVSKVAFYNDSTLIGISDKAPYALNYTPTIPGFYKILCKAYDVNGSLASTVPVYLKVVQYKILPGILKGADFDNMSGVKTEKCMDTDGGLDVGYLSKDGFVDYYVNVLSSGRYKLDVRVAGYTGMFQLFSGSNPVSGPITTISTGDYQVWKTKTDTVILHKGKQILRLKILYSGSGWNFNTLKFFNYDSTTGIHDLNQEALQIVTYPNPYNESFVVKGDFGDAAKISIHITNAYGEAVKSKDYSYFMEASAPGLVDQIQLNTKGLASGFYFLTIQKGDQTFVKKIVKN